MRDTQIFNLQQRLIHQAAQRPLGNAVNRPVETGASFGQLLNDQLSKNSPLQFSKHAQERMSERRIEVSPTLLDNLSTAVSKARDKGAKDIVIIDVSNARSAFIVNVPNNTVITTMSEADMRNNVFTNIDSAVII